MHKKRTFTPEQRLKNIERYRRYRHRNAEKLKEKRKIAYRQKWYLYFKSLTPDQKLKRNEAGRAWAARNPDKVKQRNKSYRDRFPDKIRFLKKDIAARFSKQLHPNRNHDKIREIYSEAARNTKETGKKWVVDHIIPLAKGGWHHEGNLQAMPDWFNARKKDQLHWKRLCWKDWRSVPQFLWPDQLREELLRITEEERTAPPMIIFVEGCCAA